MNFQLQTKYLVLDEKNFVQDISNVVVGKDSFVRADVRGFADFMFYCLNRIK